MACHHIPLDGQVGDVVLAHAGGRLYLDDLPRPAGQLVQDIAAHQHLVEAEGCLE